MEVIFICYDYSFFLTRPVVKLLSDSFINMKVYTRVYIAALTFTMAWRFRICFMFFHVVPYKITYF